MDGILTKKHFFFNSQRCYLGNTAVFLHFMLHRILSVTSVANFSFVHQNRARIGNVLMCGVGSVSKNVLLG